MVAKTDFLNRAMEIANEEPSYREGGWGADGTCDCIGEIIGAIRRAGGTWNGLHGSNYAARNEVEYLRPIHDDLKVGEVAFKAWKPGDDKYDLPDRYAKDPDQNDYYHVGIVLSASPLRILHMTTPRPTVDTKLGKWQYHGWLKKVSEEDKSMGELCYISGGNPSEPINMRSGEGTNRKIIAQIPQGSEAELIKYGESWCKVRYRGAEGYVKTQFIRWQESSGGSAGNGSGTGSEEGATVTIQRKKLEEIYDAIGDILGMRG